MTEMYGRRELVCVSALRPADPGYSGRSVVITDVMLLLLLVFWLSSYELRKQTGSRPKNMPMSDKSDIYSDRKIYFLFCLSHAAKCFPLTV